MHKVAKKPAGKGDPFADAGRLSARSKREINAPLSEEEKKLPPTKRHTKAGGMSERVSTMEPGGGGMEGAGIFSVIYSFLISTFLHLLGLIAISILISALRPPSHI